MKDKALDYFVELWTVRSRYYYHKLPKYVEENGEKTLEYKEVVPVYVFKKNIDWKGDITWNVCPTDYSKAENKDKSWEWSITVDQFIGKDYFFTKEEAEAKYNDIPEATRMQYEEIKQLKRLSNER